MQLSDTESQGLSRRDVLTGIAAGGAALASGLALPSAAEARRATPAPTGGSGLPWKSGCSISGWQSFVSFRGRPLDTITCWSQHDTWSDAVGLKGGFPTAKRSGAQVCVAMVPLPRSQTGANVGNWLLASRGAFDGYYRQYAQNLAASGVANPIVALGWESNDEVRPWYAGRHPEAFKDTFARMATILRQTVPGVTIEWNIVRRGSYRGSVVDMFPGKAYVDVVGMSYYDGWPAHNDEASWRDGVYREYNGGPGGLLTWFQFAREQGCQFAVREWGVWSNRPGCKDNPFYIRKMHEFFRANAQHIAYENYFNQIWYHELTGSHHPLAAAEYKRLWGRAGGDAASRTQQPSA